MIKVVCKGDYDKAFKFFNKLREAAQLKILEKYGREGVEALKNATPKRSGKTANSWTFTVERSEDSATIYWENSNINYSLNSDKGVNVALIIQYGHGTGTGGYVQGIDYINPALQPVFDKLAEDAWREVTQA